jgi:transmembrane sensor
MMNSPPSDQYAVPDFVTEFLAQGESFSRAAELQAWLQNDPINRKILDEYTDLWQGSIKARNNEDYNKEKAWKLIHRSLLLKGQEEERTHKGAFLPVLKSAAAAALAALIFSLAAYVVLRAYNSRQHPLTYSEYSVPYGSKSRMILPDSSVAWLNAGSKMVISSHYGIRNREIRLEGEAHFTVVPAQKPFRVKTLNLTIEALSTVFNIKAYPEEKTVEATVEKGAVKITDNLSGKAGSKNTIVLTNQRATFRILPGKPEEKNQEGKTPPGLSHSAGPELKGKNHSTEVTVVNVIAPENYTSWKDEKWIIEREELQSLAVKLERRYNVRILFKDEKLKKYVFSGVLKDETLEQVLEYITLTAPVGYEVQHDRVIFYEMNTLTSHHH